MTEVKAMQAKVTSATQLMATDGLSGQSKVVMMLDARVRFANLFLRSRDKDATKPNPVDHAKAFMEHKKDPKNAIVFVGVANILSLPELDAFIEQLGATATDEAFPQVMCLIDS